jgi:probable F420-dependent oxidoreductase
MHIDTQIRDMELKDVPGEAKRLEQLGFECVWTFEAKHDPFLPLAFAATSTEKMDVGTNIAVAFARSPYSMAQAAWDVQRASNGRLRLGLGTQVRAHVERRLSMPFDRPAARITDYIRCIRAIWNTFQTGDRPSYEGEFYRFLLINPFFNPGPNTKPDIPIYLAGLNPRMAKAAGEVADGFHVHPMHSRSYLKEVVRPAIQEGAVANGRVLSDVELYAPVFAVWGETASERSKTEAVIREQIAFYGSTPNYRRLFEHHGCEDQARKLSQLMRNGEFSEMPKLVPDHLMEELAIHGTFQELPTKLRERASGVLDRVSLYFPIDREDPDEMWRNFVLGCKN